MDRKPRRLPLGLVGMICLVLACETFVSNRSLDFMGDAAFAWRWGWKSAGRDALKSNMLCFGDSLVKFGVAPRVIEDRSGRTAWNLAMTGGRPANAYFLLRRALEAGARPAAVVVDADLLPSDPFEVPYLWPEMATPGEMIELAWVGRNPEFLFQCGLAYALPSYRGRHEIRTTITAAFRGESTRFRSISNLTNRNWKANRGAAILPATRRLDPATVRDLDAWPEDRARPGQWSAHPVNEVYLDKFLDLADARGIPVFWLLPPHYRMIERYFDQPNWHGLRRAFIEARIGRHPNLVVVDGTHAGYGESVVMDVSHLNRDGAVAYSLALGGILADRLAQADPAAPRWIDLPAFREPPADAPVEDLAQTSQGRSRRR